MSEAVSKHIASQRCQQARSTEWADAPPDFSRSEGFFEDIASVPPSILCLRRDPVTENGPLWTGVLAAALGLRRA